MERKSPDRRQDKRPSRDAQIVTFPDGGEVVVGLPPRGLLKATKEAWDAFRSSDAARLVRPEQLRSLTRLFSLYDEWERAYREYRSERITVGSKGQPRLNPLSDKMDRLEPLIAKLEQQFGLTPASRVKLGLAVNEMAHALAERNKRLERDSDSEQDPRLATVVESASHRRRSATS